MIDELKNIPIEFDDESGFEASLISDIEAALAGPEPAGIEPEEQAPAQPEWIGKVLGHFKLLRLIGQGTMGLVVQAMDVHLKRVVALKILRKRIEGLAEEKGVRQFLREAQAAAKIEHPNVIRIYEIDQHEGWWYIAMEWLEGQDLQKVVRAAGPLAPARACLLVADAATALSVAHEAGIIHRDVKPSNLMITRTGHCKLTDFGFVRLQDPGDPLDFTDRSVGTPQFMAPEIVQGRRPTPAVDVYSLGATLYFALTGRPPYTGRTVAEICRQHLTSPPPSVRAHVPSCSESLSGLIERAMAKDPAARPTADEVAGALHAEAVAFRADDSGVPAAPPPFSWVGRVPAEGVRFVAGKRGRHYYRIDDPAAGLIRAEDFVGYRTAKEARAAGRTPAP